VSCPSGSSDAQERGAATAAYNIMKAAASACGGATDGPCWGTTIIASQRYSIVPAATGGWETIQFEPTSYGYSNVPQAAKAALAFAQLDSDTAAFLVAGLRWAMANTNGTTYPQVVPTAALMNFTYPGNQTPINIPDPNAGQTRRHDVVTGSPWCNTQKIHFVDSSYYEANVAPMKTQSYVMFESARQARFTGSNSWPTTPFNGSGGTNPYLVVAVNGSQISWNTSSWPTMDCSGISDPKKCSGTIDIDPIPYAEPGSYYDSTGNLVGTQSNPYSIVGSLYAVSDHQQQWATRTVNGIQEWGTFTTPVSLLGVTLYKYTKQM
jgi:hypothetical protein